MRLVCVKSDGMFTHELDSDGQWHQFFADAGGRGIQMAS